MQEEEEEVEKMRKKWWVMGVKENGKTDGMQLEFSIRGEGRRLRLIKAHINTNLLIQSSILFFTFQKIKSHADHN